VPGVEAGLHALQPEEAVEQQSRTDQQRERERELRDQLARAEQEHAALAARQTELVGEEARLAELSNQVESKVEALESADKEHAEASAELAKHLASIAEREKELKRERHALEAKVRDAEARVAAAVGLFDKDRPALAFSRLGPLVRVFPRAPTVRFHLGLLLFWTGRIQAGRLELERARAEGPATPLGRAAARSSRAWKPWP
jgi:hypothetical protein